MGFKVEGAIVTGAGVDKAGQFMPSLLSVSDEGPILTSDACSLQVSWPLVTLSAFQQLEGIVRGSSNLKRPAPPFSAKKSSASFPD